MAVALAAMLCLTATAGAAADLDGPGPTRISRAPGAFVPIPASIPHRPGSYIDRRIVRDLAWITTNFDVYVIEGYAGPLEGGATTGCPHCHVENSEHKIGLAVDLIPLKYRLLPDSYDFDVPCDRSWRDVTRIAHWAEPSQYHPVPPFRWIGYEGDANHGCGDHLHLSWVHNPRYKRFHTSKWVELFPAPPLRTPASGDPPQSG